MAIKTLALSSADPVSGIVCRTLSGIVVNTSQGSCDIIDVRGIRTLSVKPVSAGSAITTLTFYGCDTNNGTFVLIDSLGTNGVVTVVDSVWNVLDPTKIAPHAFIQMKPSATGTATLIGKN